MTKMLNAEDLERIVKRWLTPAQAHCRRCSDVRSPSSSAGGIVNLARCNMLWVQTSPRTWERILFVGLFTLPGYCAANDNAGEDEGFPF